MFGRKKAPAVKIPSSILKKEAEKMAKKMLRKEEEKEKKRATRERAKEKAAKKVARKKTDDANWDEFAGEGLNREIYGGIWISAAILLTAVFFSDADLSVQISTAFQFLFGLGRWLLLALCAGLGVILLARKDVNFPPLRVFGFLLFFVTILGLLNLFLPQNESLALAHKYGGVIGFTMDFFPREFLGDAVTLVLLLGLLWISSVLAFGIRLSDLFRKKEVEIKSGKKKTTEEKEEKTSLVKKHFKNELEIIDSTGGAKETKKPTEEIDLSPTDELTEAKNQTPEGEWEPPDLDLLKDTHATITVNEKDLRKKAESIREKLDQFGLDVEMRSVHVGPTVTQFTLEPAPGVKLTKITGLKSDLALALAAPAIRIEAPIPGEKLVGIEIPNEKRAIVGMREIIESDSWEELDETSLKLAIGRNVAGKPMVADLAKMPHLLIAGKTGSGKSVAMNSFLISLLWQNSPEDLRMILIDPKRVELSLYNHLPHLLTPVIVEPEKSVSALAWAVAEMNRRYKDFAQKQCRNIGEYNEKHPDEKEPYIVIVIDELADLMMVAGKDVEAAICRIAQMARAVGLHLIVATQRPSVDVVTGLIKANLPARIAFKVSSGIDSRTIIDGVGAEDLLGFGDMLYLDGNSGTLTRSQGIYISNAEVERVTNNIKLQFPEQMMNDEITKQSIEGMAKGGVLTAGTEEISDDDLDPLYEEAVNLVIETGKASASFLQRRLEVGYARAARLLDQMESRGIIGPSKGAKAREIFGRQE